MPIEKMNFPGVSEFLTKYQARAQQEGVDALGYHIAPWGYAQLQVLQQAVAATNSVDDDKLVDYIRKSTFKTLVGDVKFGPHASGRSRGCWRFSSSISRATISPSSRTFRPKS
jgi:branched-chain amino acid transport system substrate-binding protein